MWQIIDNNGVIYSGTEEEMLNMWDNILGINKYKGRPCEIYWIGDLKLIQIHQIHK